MVAAVASPRRLNLYGIQDNTFKSNSTAAGRAANQRAVYVFK
ncbi:MAG TPA: hypothetical protein VND89_01705 [Acidimicrobiales bacterium]|nr:hypothetical protein [Acidimicrobiales bacterium]